MTTVEELVSSGVAEITVERPLEELLIESLLALENESIYGANADKLWEGFRTAKTFSDLVNIPVESIDSLVAEVQAGISAANTTSAYDIIAAIQEAPPAPLGEEDWI